MNPHDELSAPPEVRHRLRRGILATGFLLMLLNLVDMAYQVYPLDPMNPTWEYLTAGRMAERYWSFLLGLALVLMPLGDAIDASLLRLRCVARWLALAYAAFLLFLIPVMVLSSWRLHKAMEQEYSSWARERQTQSEEAIARLKSLPSREAILRFVAPLQFSEELTMQPGIRELKDVLAARLEGFEANSIAEARALTRERQKSLWVDTSKGLVFIVLGVAGFWLLWIFSQSYRQILEFASPEEQSR